MQLARGEYCGWMHGLPQAIKDLTATKGIRTTQGSRLFKDFVPTADATTARINIWRRVAASSTGAWVCGIMMGSVLLHGPDQERLCA